jgi:hypothetical protein
MNYETFSGRNQEEKLGSGDAISKGEIERLSFLVLSLNSVYGYERAISENARL